MTGPSPGILRQATTQDVVKMDEFLARHAATSMFLRSNLAACGTDETSHPHGTSFFLTRDADGVSGVFGLTNGGYLMAQAPAAQPAEWTGFAQAISGRTVRGMTGVPAQVQACLAACGLAHGPFQLLADEPLYHLNIADLVDHPADVRTPHAGDVPMLKQWFTAYETDTGMAPPTDAPTDSACARAAAAIGAAHIVILEDAGQPVAMAAINAHVADMVQIGGVFTPDGLRGRGYARRAVAGLLRRAAIQDGAAQSVLFANNTAAAHAYEALGYQRVGDYRVALLAAPTEIGDHA